MNGGSCHGFVSEEVHGGIQGGGGTAAGIGGVSGRVARTCEVNLNVLHRWRRELREDREKVFPAIGPAAGERKPGGGTGAEDRSASPGDRFFATLLAASRRTAEAACANWKAAVYEQIEPETKAGGRLTRRRMCQLGQVSRAGFYRHRQTPERVDRDMKLRDASQPPRSP